MRIWASGLLVIVAIGAGAALRAQAPPTHPHFSGAYARHGNIFGQPTAAQLADKTIPPRNPPAPLKPGPMKEYQDRLAAIREADRKGTPIATGYRGCLGAG